MKKVLVHGAYKGDNFGDTLLLVMMINELKKKNVDIVLSNTCEPTYSRCKEVTNVRLLKGISDIIFCDCIIFGGGGYFGEQPKNKRIWYLNFIKNHLLIGYFFVLMRKPIAFIGVEFGELSNSFIRWLTCILLNHATIIGARNNGSLAWVKENAHFRNTVQTADMALNICNFDRIDKDISANHEVLIHPSFDPEVDLATSQMVKCLNEINWAEYHIRLSLILDRNNDQSEKLINSWANALDGKISNIYRYENPIKLCNIIKSCSCIISNKLHTTIVASSFGRCVISVAKHPKNKRFFEDIGRPDLNISHARFDLKKFEKLLKLFKDNELDPVSLSEKVRSRAVKNYELIDEFLKKV